MRTRVPWMGLVVVVGLAGLLGSAAQAAKIGPAPPVTTRPLWVPVPAFAQQVDCGQSVALPPIHYLADPTETHYEARLRVAGQGYVSLMVADPPAGAQALVNSPAVQPLTLAVDLPYVPPAGVQLTLTLAGPDCTSGAALFVEDLNLRGGP